VNTNNSKKWRGFRVPKKVEQINDYLLDYNGYTFHNPERMLACVKLKSAASGS